MQAVAEVRAVPGRGLAGDRYFTGSGFYSTRPSHGGGELTLIELEAVEALFGGVINAEGERLRIKLAAGCPTQHRDFGRSAESSGRV